MVRLKGAWGNHLQIQWAGRALRFCLGLVAGHQVEPDKAYAIGDYVHAIKRVFPATTKEEKLGTPVGDDPELVGLARRCGEVC